MMEGILRKLRLPKNKRPSDFPPAIVAKHRAASPGQELSHHFVMFVGNSPCPENNGSLSPLPSISANLIAKV
jgi:hypothetical protein